MTIFGIIFTATYILAIIFLRWANLSDLQTMPLNELGDFLAGVFGPLMLLWLILGYIQQQKELRQNTKALELQADELRKSVEQHKELVAATREQVQADLKSLEIEEIRSLREAHPVFSVTSAGWGSRTGVNFKFNIMILNSGQPASSVKFSSSPSIRQIESSGIVHYFASGQTQTISWDSEVSGDAPAELRLVINCRDANTRPYTKIFEMVLDSDNKYHLTGTSEAG
ncbi:hypothetical protein DN062_05260 [Nitrincola tibetensis]|uniref:Uncharacterized protein n=1 Tax=Nitrincola tibetensis TaxID=2219697 RepID=A0A364NP74_9GAMM|nr:hypothetical protein [Nitrincola tibetensis]RAU18891.1 hypothetical protein DN062_05260 [Nitrincola tibetensis]